MKMTAIWDFVKTIIIDMIIYEKESLKQKKNEMAQIEAIFNKILKTFFNS